MADIEVFRSRNTTGLAINGMRVTNTKPYGLIQTTQLFKCKDENIIEALGADVQPVKRGHWMSIGNQYEWLKTYTCSECRHSIVTYKCNYCPDCGADMRDADAGEIANE